MYLIVIKPTFHLCNQKPDKASQIQRRFVTNRSVDPNTVVFSDYFSYLPYFQQQFSHRLIH